LVEGCRGKFTLGTVDTVGTLGEVSVMSAAVRAE
jgi:hypothetical protein